MKKFTKDPDGILDFVWDWSDWMAENDSIASFNFTIPTDLTEVDSTEANDEVTLWLSGGTVNKSYTVVCSIVTADGREDDRSAIFKIKER